MNNIIEQDHRFIRRKIKPGLGWYCQLNLKEAELKQVSPQFANSASFLASDVSRHFSPILQSELT